MTIFGDKLLGSILPTRDGTAQGHGAERVMMSAVGGPDGTRTRIVSNQDGTTTLLRTRNGMPEFSTSGQKGASKVEPEYERGFVARVQTKAFGALFSPYTLAVSNPNYKLINITYTVLPFASTHNVAYTDTTHWYDVLTFQGSMIRVNGKKLPVLVMGGFVPGSKAIPWLIPLPPTPYTGLGRYGDKATNADAKRVFSVRRDEVKSFGGGGTTQTLTPTTPRTTGKAMTIGPRIDPATNKAYLGQLFFTADAWDDSGAEWGFSAAEVAMLLTAPYLTKVSSGMSVAMAPPSLADQGTSTGTMRTAVTLPAVPWGVVGTGRIEDPILGVKDVLWNWSSVLSETRSGAIEAAYTRYSYGGSSTSTQDFSGILLDYYGANSLQLDSRNEYTTFDTAIFYYPGASRTDATEDILIFGPPWVWNTGLTTGTVSPYRGRTTKVSPGQIIGNTGVTGKVYSEQAGVFYVRKGSDDLVHVAFSVSKEYGDSATILPNTTYYDSVMGVSSVGGSGSVGKERLVSTSNDADYLAELQAMADAVAAQSLFDDETSSGSDRANVSPSTSYYWGNIAYIDSRNITVSWATKDYVLHDVANGVFVSVEGTYSGVNTSATLTVILRVKTRHHETVQTLDTSTYSGQVLTETYEIDALGVWVVPSPQLRAIFAPLYCEQGTFKGVHYVTALEEANGATPFHGFNFVLRLKMYDALATLNQQNDVNTEIGFIPCNLLEMLYAFVFSQQYGVAGSGDRYPVEYPSRLKALSGSLFANAVRVNIRNGVNADWLDTLGAPYIDDTTSELYRT